MRVSWDDSLAARGDSPLLPPLQPDPDSSSLYQQQLLQQHQQQADSRSASWPQSQSPPLDNESSAPSFLRSHGSAWRERIRGLSRVTSHARSPSVTLSGTSSVTPSAASPVEGMGSSVSDPRPRSRSALCGPVTDCHTPPLLVCVPPRAAPKVGGFALSAPQQQARPRSPLQRTPQQPSATSATSSPQQQHKTLGSLRQAGAPRSGSPVRAGIDPTLERRRSRRGETLPAVVRQLGLDPSQRSLVQSLLFPRS